MTRWDNLYERYFNYLATLSFDKVEFERNYHNFGFVGLKVNISGIRRDVSMERRRVDKDIFLSLTKSSFFL